LISSTIPVLFAGEGREKRSGDEAGLSRMGFWEDLGRLPNSTNPWGRQWGLIPFADKGIRGGYFPPFFPGVILDSRRSIQWGKKAGQRSKGRESG
jgi:hypothetical protein